MFLWINSKKEKGQDLVEYALLLGLIVGVGWFVCFKSGLSDSIKSIFDGATNVLNVAVNGDLADSDSDSGSSKNPYDLNAFMKYVNDIMQTKYTGNGSQYQLRDDENYKKGMLMSCWLVDGDKKDSKVTEMAKELGADLWTYYNGLGDSNNINPQDKGFYWTTDKVDSSQLQTTYGKDGTNLTYSQEKVLSYYYDGSHYYVLKNNVWMGQGSQKGLGLAAKSQQYEKPQSEQVGMFNSYEAAQEAYNKAKAENHGSAIFKS